MSNLQPSHSIFLPEDFPAPLTSSPRRCAAQPAVPEGSDAIFVCVAAAVVVTDHESMKQAVLLKGRRDGQTFIKRTNN